MNVLDFRGFKLFEFDRIEEDNKSGRILLSLTIDRERLISFTIS